MPLFLKEK